MKMMRHAKGARDEFRLIDAACARAMHIQFLQRNDIWILLGNDARDPLGRTSPVAPDASVNIPCEETRQ
jgi:hypothetical protein